MDFGPATGGEQMMEPGKRVLLLMTSRTYRARSFLAAAEALGVSVLVATEAETPLSGERGARIDFADPEGAPDEILTLARRTSIDAVVSAEDDGTWLAAEVARRLGVPHNPPESVAIVRDKAAMRETILASGLPTPKGMRIDIGADPEEMAGSIAYPSVLKPRFLAGSQGVIRVNDPAEFVFAFQRIRRLIQQPEIANLGGELADAVWCEVYVPGDEVAVEGMLYDGQLQVLAIFDKPDPLDGPFFEETVYVTPSRHPETDQAQIMETTQQVVRALGLRTGPVHVELRLNAGGVHVIDVAARSIGGLCSKALRFDLGESLESVILRQALGEDVRQVKRESAASGVMMIPIPRAGKLMAVSGEESAESVPGIEEVVLSVPVGEKLVPLPEGGSYLGFIFGRSESPAGVEAALRESHSRLVFDILDEG